MQIECVVDSRSALGEGAVWDVVDQALWWVDIYGHLVHRFDPVTGRNSFSLFLMASPLLCLLH